MGISSTLHLGHRRLIRGSGEGDSRFFLPRLSFGKTKDLSPVVGSLSTMTAKKAGLGLLNPVTSDQETYLRSTRGSAELVRAVAGGGVFSNANHLQTLSDEQRDGKKA